MEYIVEDNGVYTRKVTEAGTIIVAYHDAEYHLRLTQDGDTVTAQVYDYLGEQQDVDGVEVTFGAGEWSETVETTDGAASVAVPEGAVEVTASATGYRAGLITIGS